MEELIEVLQRHKARYPQATAVDLVKLVYQSEFGPGHFITDEGASLARLEEECRSLQTDGVEDELFEPIGRGLVRLHLRALPPGVSLFTVNRFFVLTAQKVRGSREGLRDGLQGTRKCALQHKPQPTPLKAGSSVRACPYLETRWVGMIQSLTGH